MKISVNLADHPYDILIERGMIHHIAKHLKSLWSTRAIVLITDDNVNQLYGEGLKSSLLEAGFDVSVFEFPAGETSKSLKTAEEAWDFCAKSGLTRADGILALGGGVVGDLAGFVASTYMRGLSFVQVPTSLTAQVDSSIGGKTAVNSSFAKNMIGSFAQPAAVFIDPDLLSTLDERCLREGMGEVIKCALIADKELWDRLRSMSGDDILEEAEYLIEHAINQKRSVVLEDQFDTGARLSLNFGHTLGHAIEASTDFQVMHGEAVGIGMLQISAVAEKKALIKAGLTGEIRSMLEKFHLPTRANVARELLLEQIVHDKKTRGDQIQIILVPEVGTYEIHTMGLQNMYDFCDLTALQETK